MIRNRDALTDHGNERPREAALDVATAALQAVHPSRTVPAAVTLDGTTLHVDGREFDLDAVDDLYVVGAGKGSAAVVDAVLEILGEHVTEGVVAEKGDHRDDSVGSRDDRLTLLGAGHPIPDETSLDAGRAVVEIADRAGPDDLVIACITGGASAQCVLPSDGVSLADLRETTERLLTAGLPIEEINAVRKHLSEIKGGRLTQRLAPATVVTLVVVDEVAGQPWGPTVGDGTTFGEALDVLGRHGLTDDVPQAVLDHLRRGRAGELPETPTPEDVDTVAVVLADAADACETARDRAAALGYEPMVLSTSIEGESREVATVFAGIADEIVEYGRPVEPPCAVVSGGETTVTVHDDAGEGGPNQEFGLAFALETVDLQGVTALALGTDGTDGPTPVAGALVDDSTIPRLRAEGVDPLDHLHRHDTSEPLERVDDAVYTGPTGTNVMDLRVVIVEE